MAFNLAKQILVGINLQKGIIFGAGGNQNLVLSNGKNYDGNTDHYQLVLFQQILNKLVDGYAIFENTENYSVDFLIMGSANYGKSQAQALANKLIAVADIRKDALAFISPYRQAFLTDTDAGTVTVNNDETITDNVLSFYAPLTSSSYAVFDSGYKYMYDRFSNTFRYIPLNGDIAGLCARNDIDNFPWFSPAGTSRGAILNAVKLAYNPSQSQRDRLYSNRINPVILSPGAGIVLFGDKTGFAKSSAFDRINVRRLFIYLEDAISAAARDQLFEFNDEVTRTNFVNIVEPFLRDVQAKRGIQDFVVICDETNNTAAIIDNNEFVADIFIKPARSINFIGLTFVATRTGVSFEEVIGNV
jgi:phage tail sheath protein FI